MTRYQVRVKIVQAFDGVELGNGVGLWEADESDGPGGEHPDMARSRDERKNWRAISETDILKANSALSFTDEEGMRFLLPAFLIAALNSADSPIGIEPVLNPFYLLTEGRDDRMFDKLCDRQRGAVRAYLQWILTQEGYEHERSAIERSLVTYWAENKVSEP